MSLCNVYLNGERNKKKTAFAFVLSVQVQSPSEQSQNPGFIHFGFCLTDREADLIERFWSLKLSGHH